MLLILHGDNTVLSRNHLQQLTLNAKQKGVRDILHQNGRKLKLEELIQALETQSLFDSDRLVIIENLHSHPSKSTLKDLLLYLSALDARNSKLILWESKTLTPAQLKKLAQFKAQLFKQSPTIFKLLDSLGQTPQQTLPLLHQSIASDSAEMVFYMLSRQVRLLLQVGGPDIKMPPWQVGKLKAQAKTLGQLYLLNLHQKLYNEDWNIKSGQSAHGLAGDLELLLCQQ